jgi:hypothetical protein
MKDIWEEEHGKWEVHKEASPSQNQDEVWTILCEQTGQRM